MKELLVQYAHYNVWANKQIINVLLKQGEEAAKHPLASSFPTLHETMLHVWSAESIWLQRLQLVEHPIWHGLDFDGTFAEGCSGWERSSATLVRFASEQTEESLNEAIAFKYRAGNEGKLRVHEVLHHVFNHSTYHRGQFVTMLRQLGVTKIPGTDFAGFAAI